MHFYLYFDNLWELAWNLNIGYLSYMSSPLYTIHKDSRTYVGNQSRVYLEFTVNRSFGVLFYAKSTTCTFVVASYTKKSAHA